MGSFPGGIISDDRIVDLRAHSKQDALAELIAIVSASPDAGDPEEVRRKILEREATHSTGIGLGIAMPHAKTTTAKGFVIAVGRSLSGIDFDAVDGKPVNIVVMMICHENQAGEFLKVMARLAKCLKDKDFRRQVLLAKGSPEIRQLFLDAPA